MKVFFKITVLGLLLSLTTCQSQSQSGITTQPSSATSPSPGTPGIANPASVNCQNKGGRLVIRQSALGETGYCVFSDGSECEEWAFFQGRCQQGQNKP